MLNKNTVLLALISVMFLSSCYNINLKEDKKYNKYINYFDKNLTSHFPKEYKSFNNDYSYTVDTTAQFNTEEINLTFRNASKQIDSIKSLYKNKFITVDNDCVVVVNDFLKSNNLILDENEVYMSKSSEKCKDYFIIPNFWNNLYNDSSTKSGLNNNFKYVVLENQLGNFSKKINYNISYMPSAIIHGYSKGIAINEKESIIIYWGIIW